MLLLLLPLLLSQASSSERTCDVGEAVIDDIPSRYLHGAWKVAYVRPRNISVAFVCWEDDYSTLSDGGIGIRTSMTLRATGERISLSGTVDINGHILNYSYPNSPLWSSNYEILAWEENKFQIGGCCLEVNNYTAANWISFRQLPPPEDSLRAALNALNKTGLRFDDFGPNCGPADQV